MEIYEDLKEMSEVLNENFQKVFTTVSDFRNPNKDKRKKLYVGNQSK